MQRSLAVAEALEPWPPRRVHADPERVPASSARSLASTHGGADTKRRTQRASVRSVLLGCTQGGRTALTRVVYAVSCQRLHGLMPGSGLRRREHVPDPRAHAEEATAREPLPQPATVASRPRPGTISHTHCIFHDFNCKYKYV